jgi:ABC-type xylose transport system permease subunit
MKSQEFYFLLALHKLFVGGGKKSWQKWTIVGLNVLSFIFQLAGLFIWVKNVKNRLL